uniref:Uncharacterized protein n=1 Tax=Sphaerodactylus townsendi TaxID=933632 RepID=A0ACB8FXM8_9SAUR
MHWGKAHCMLDTKRAVEILARYQGILQCPEEQPLQASIGKVVHIFQSELFQALLDIQECYELSLFSASKQDGTPDLEPCTSWKQHSADAKFSLDDQGHHKLALQGELQGRAAWSQDSGQAPRLVRVTETRTEPPARVHSLVVGICSTLPKVRLVAKEGWKQGLRSQDKEGVNASFGVIQRVFVLASLTKQ